MIIVFVSYNADDAIVGAIVLHESSPIISTIITPIIMHDNMLDNAPLCDHYHDYYHA